MGCAGLLLLLLGTIAGDGGIWPLWACVLTSVLGLILMQAGISGHKKSPAVQQHREAKSQNTTIHIIPNRAGDVNDEMAAAPYSFIYRSI